MNWSATSPELSRKMVAPVNRLVLDLDRALGLELQGTNPQDGDTESVPVAGPSAPQGNKEGNTTGEENWIAKPAEHQATLPSALPLGDSVGSETTGSISENRPLDQVIAPPYHVAQETEPTPPHYVAQETESAPPHYIAQETESAPPHYIGKETGSAHLRVTGIRARMSSDSLLLPDVRSAGQYQPPDSTHRRTSDSSGSEVAETGSDSRTEGLPDASSFPIAPRASSLRRNSDTVSSLPPQRHSGLESTPGNRTGSGASNPEINQQKTLERAPAPDFSLPVSSVSHPIAFPGQSGVTDSPGWEGMSAFAETPPGVEGASASTIIPEPRPVRRLLPLQVSRTSKDPAGRRIAPIENVFPASVTEPTTSHNPTAFSGYSAVQWPVEAQRLSREAGRPSPPKAGTPGNQGETSELGGISLFPREVRSAALRISERVEPSLDQAHQLIVREIPSGHEAPRQASPAQDRALPSNVQNTFNVNVSLEGTRGEVEIDPSALEEAMIKVLKDTARRHGLQV